MHHVVNETVPRTITRTQSEHKDLFSFYMVRKFADQKHYTLHSYMVICYRAALQRKPYTMQSFDLKVSLNSEIIVPVP